MNKDVPDDLDQDLIDGIKIRDYLIGETRAQEWREVTQEGLMKFFGIKM